MNPGKDYDRLPEDEYSQWIGKLSSCLPATNFVSKTVPCPRVYFCNARACSVVSVCDYHKRLVRGKSYVASLVCSLFTDQYVTEDDDVYSAHQRR